MWSKIILGVAGATALYFSYSFADERWVQKNVYLGRIASLHVLDRNPNWAAQPAQIKMLAAKQYTDSWYYSIGHGLVNVFIWTFL